MVPTWQSLAAGEAPIEMAASVASHASLDRQLQLPTHRGDPHQQLPLRPALGMVSMSTDGPELLAAKRLLDGAKAAGFTFCRIAPGEDGPLLGRRDTIGYQDEIYLGGFADSCSAVRRRRWSLVVPGGLPVTERINGDALTVLHTVLRDWPA
jgi:hypothetical protein